MPIGKYIYCTKGYNMTLNKLVGHKCLSASTFTVPRGFPEVTPPGLCCHKCLSASTFTVPGAWTIDYISLRRSQMPIGKYIYCTYGLRVQPQPPRKGVTNAYRQVHLLYGGQPRAGLLDGCSHKCLSASTFTVRI